MLPIDTSIFELLKIGPGPSSSHTIGPMKAGWNFIQQVNTMPDKLRTQASKLSVTLLGSLSATGKGHGTDRAVVAGLLGHAPEDCTAEVLDDLKENEFAKKELPIKGASLKFSVSDVVFGSLETNSPHANTLVITLRNESGGVLFEREYYSVGGGFIEWKGYEPPTRGKPRFPYSNMADIKEIMQIEDLALRQIMMENEMSITGASREEIHKGLDKIINAMLGSVEAGLAASGDLPGPLGVRRKANALIRSSAKKSGTDREVLKLIAYAFAASEENAAGHRIVTAPTCGAAGVLPACVKLLHDTFKVDRHDIRWGLLVAAAIGFFCKHNAAIAGAEVGCQGEVGVASAMAAAMLTVALREDTGLRATQAAEIALEHHLGMTCDPIQGFVQIPCIERNAFGAVKAYTAYLIATNEVESFHKVSLDATIRAMAESGAAMSCKFKETSTGGLAICYPLC